MCWSRPWPHDAWSTGSLACGFSCPVANTDVELPRRQARPRRGCERRSIRREYYGRQMPALTNGQGYCKQLVHASESPLSGGQSLRWRRLAPPPLLCPPRSRPHIRRSGLAWRLFNCGRRCQDAAGWWNRIKSIRVCAHTRRWLSGPGFTPPVLLAPG